MVCPAQIACSHQQVLDPFQWIHPADEQDDLLLIQIQSLPGERPIHGLEQFQIHPAWDDADGIRGSTVVMNEVVPFFGGSSDNPVALIGQYLFGFKAKLGLTFADANRVFDRAQGMEHDDVWGVPPLLHPLTHPTRQPVVAVY